MADSPSRRAVVQGQPEWEPWRSVHEDWPRAKRPAPNFVVIMSDEHDGGVMGCMGDPVVRTPHLDRLAEQGVLFRSCYTPSPVCGPARLAFTFGQYASRRRIGPIIPFPNRTKSRLWRAQLQAVGYRTLLCGKQHYMPGRRYGFKELGKNYNHFEKNGLGTSTGSG